MLSRPYAPFDLCNADVIYCSMYIQYSIYIFMSADPGIPPARGIPERARCMLPARHARSTQQQAGSARQGSARLGSTRLGRNGGPSASAQHLGPCSRTRRAHAHEAVPAPPPAGARTNARAPDPAVLPLCRHSLPRGRGVGEGTRAMPIAKDTPPEGRGSREIRAKRAADTTASSAMAAGATDTTVVGTTAADSQGMAVTRRSRGGGSGRRLSLPLRGTGAQSATVKRMRADTRQAHWAETRW